MGLFGRKRSAPPKADNSLARAVITPAVLTMVSDGSASESELAQLSNLCSFSPIFFGISNDGLLDILKAVVSEASSSGPMPVLTAAAAQLSPPLRETALTFAMRIALADGVVEEGEKNALSATGAVLEIAPDTFNKILEVVVMMQRSASSGGA